jgi:hypothetical protein
MPFSIVFISDRFCGDPLYGSGRTTQGKESNPFIRAPCALSRAPFLFFKF